MELMEETKKPYLLVGFAAVVLRDSSSGTVESGCGVEEEDVTAAEDDEYWSGV